MPKSRPLTVREVQASKKPKTIEKEITITNISKQVIAIHMKAPKGVDFYAGAQDIRLRPNQSFKFKKSRIQPGQLDRLRNTRQISVANDTIDE